MRRLDLDVDEIVRLYVDEGLRASAIAARMGCSDGAILSRLTEAGVGRSSSARLDRDHVITSYRGLPRRDDCRRARSGSGDRMPVGR